MRACPAEPRCVRVNHLTLEPSRRHIAPTAASSDKLPVHMTVSVAFPLYLAYLEREGRTQNTLALYRSIFARWLDHTVGRRPVNDLSTRDITAAVDRMRDRVPAAAAVAKSLLQGLSDWAAAEDL